MVGFKCKRAIPIFLILRKLTAKILNILNRLLLSYFFIYFDQTLRAADPQNILLWLHISLPKLLITVFLKKKQTKNNDCLYTQWISCNFLRSCQNGLTHHFLWVSPLVNFKKRLFSNKHKEVISNNKINEGASETKLCSHVGETPFFIPMLFSKFPPKVG